MSKSRSTKYIKTKVLTNCFYLIKSLFLKNKRVWNQSPYLIVCMICEKYLSDYILLIYQFTLTDCRYFLRHWVKGGGGGIFYQTQQKILLLSRNSKQKLILGHLTTVLVEYTKNILGEQDSAKLFHRFCTFGFVILLLDHLHIIFLICTLFSDIFS